MCQWSDGWEPTKSGRDIKTNRGNRRQLRIANITADFIHARKLLAGYWTAAIVAVATCIVFIPALWNQFVDWDDYEALVNNPAYRGLGWSQLQWMFTTFHLGHYQPLSWITLGLDYLVWGLNPFGYHLTNLFLHAANAVLFYFISRRLLAKSLAPDDVEPSAQVDLSAAFAALLFAIHPLRIESVAWATERRDVLSGFFFFWTIYCYLRAHETSRVELKPRWFYAALAVYGLSLLSKATAMTLPVVLLLLDLYPLRRLRGGPTRWLRYPDRKILLEKLPFLLLAISCALVALLAQRSVGVLLSVQRYAFGSRVGQAFYGIIFYLWKTFLPIHLSPLYELPYDPDPWLPVFALSAMGAVAVSIVFYLLRRRWPALLACWVYYVVTLSPVLGIAQSGPQLVADRYSYLSCLSWALLVAGLFFSRHKKSFPVSAVAAGTLCVLGFLTWRQIGVWRDTRTFWQYVLAVAPTSSLAHYNFGTTLEAEGRETEAIEMYERAATLNPTNAPAHHNLARLLARNGRQEEAIRHYRLALEINPKDADTRNNLGLLLAVRGDTQAALDELRKAVQIDPNYARAYFNMGRIYARQGDLDNALAKFQQALTIDPNEAEVHLGIGNVLARQGQLSAAAAHFQRAVEIRPDFPDAHVALARLLAALGRTNEAEKQYEVALKLLKTQNPNRSSSDLGDRSASEQR